ncbi:TasA family protein [Alkalihalobacillus sp. AL-G]|uniref:TasA family protein n=1 Tax=Alkalihalobacillus sp. AL-G TaxID=2926399 RepID=UPI00272AB6FA|nr:TasA family protein [Alkalihalobacillus sp. AL-G]WLD91510.1 CalY family protein [Alkalihalobacillus sp. AL-G]
MSIKKKLGLGVATAALGLSLVGGGTWAAFNDVENLENSFAAGTLDLDLAKEPDFDTTFNLSNLKPGDSMTRQFRLNNTGSLAIKEVWLDMIQSGFTNGTNEFVGDHKQPDNNALQFLDQFKVEILRTGVEAGSPGDHYIINGTEGITLKDIVTGSFTKSGVTDTAGRINLAPTNSTQPEYTGIPANPTDYEIVEIKLSFIDDPAKVLDKSSAAYGEFKQNKYQGDSINLTFQMEATQWQGVHSTSGDYTKEENRTADPQDQ